MLDQHPVARWATVGTLVGSFAAAVFFIIDERERSLGQSDLLSEIRREQEEIRRELNSHTIKLNSVEDDLKDYIAASDRRFTMRADEHRWLASEINRVTGGMSFELGRLDQLHDMGDHVHNRPTRELPTEGETSD